MVSSSRFAVVEDQQVHARQERIEIGARGFDPEIHRVGDDKTRPLHLIEHVGLQRGRDVRQQDEIGLAIRLRQVRSKMLEDIQRHRARLARVHVPGIFARPAESFPGHALHAFRVDLARFPEVEFRRRKIVADDADEFHRRKKARAERGVGSGAAEQVGVLLHRSFDGIERDGTNDENRH